jgi:glycosyltransferase involved in cell wall biosynthesis
MNAVVLIAAYNEAQRIAATVEAAKTIPSVRAIIVVDDGSLDATAAIAKDAGAIVLRLAKNSGKGRALETGLDYIIQSLIPDAPAAYAAPDAPDVLGALGAICTPDVVLLLDGDLGKSAANAHVLLEQLGDSSTNNCSLNMQYDLAIAILPSKLGSGGFGLVKNLATNAIRQHASKELLARGFPLAPLSGQRAIRVSALQALRPFAQGFGVETIMTIRALQTGLRITEVNVSLTHAYTGRNISGFLHRAHQYLDIRKALRDYKSK